MTLGDPYQKYHRPQRYQTARASKKATNPRKRKLGMRAVPTASSKEGTAGHAIVNDVVTILRHVGTPLHASKIVKGLKAHDRTIGALPLSAQLSKATKWEGTPLRVAERDTFGLSETRKPQAKAFAGAGV
jgi:hypothetical protein